MLNELALYMSWLPVLTLLSTHLKRFTWLCHFCSDFALGLVSAELAGIAGDDLGRSHHWIHVIGSWVLACSVAVLLWITV